MAYYYLKMSGVYETEKEGFMILKISCQSTFCAKLWNDAKVILEYGHYMQILLIIWYLHRETVLFSILLLIVLF